GDPINKVDPTGYAAVLAAPLAVPAAKKGAAWVVVAFAAVGASTVTNSWVRDTPIDRAIRNRRNRTNFHRAELVNSGGWLRIEVQRNRIPRSTALRRARNNGDVMVAGHLSRARARSLANSASTRNKAVRHGVHLNVRAINPRPHYHPHNGYTRNGRRILGPHIWWR
ncbi:MAG: hypothetical protein FWD93_06580, partial [Coriobacteriia bacterium]|nr:hypothetical protein [Coriobacteriia bacterium]